MKSLLDIQQETQCLEDGIREIVRGLETLQEDLEEMRSSDRAPETDYERIERLAGQIRLEGHPLGGLQDERVCRLYLEMLLQIVRMDPEQETAERRLAWIQGLNLQAGTDRTLEEMHTQSFQTDSRTMGEFAEALPEACRECFLVDALVIANLCGCANAETLEYLAGLGEILEITGERLRELSLFARTMLSRSTSGMGRADLEALLEAAWRFGYYLEEDIVRQAVEDLRHVAVALQVEDTEDFRWKAAQLQTVEQGDIIAVYRAKKPKTCTDYFQLFKMQEKENHPEQSRTILRADVSGTLYQFRLDHIIYGVIGHRMDRKEAIREWVKGGKK